MNNTLSNAPKKQNQVKEIWKRFKKNKLAIAGLFVLFVLVFVAIFADEIAPYSYEEQNLREKLKGPSWSHPLGSDNFGRDIMSRLMYGARISMAVGFVAVFIGLLGGGILGAIAGYFGKTTDIIIMRFVDILLAVPQVILAVAVCAALGQGIDKTMLAVGISSIPTYARVVRAAVMTTVDTEFIEAARSIGASNSRIILQHILPNCVAPIIVQATAGMASAIIATSSLSFIGLGVLPPTPEWGSMLSAGRAYLRSYPHMVLSPGVAIVLAVFSINMIGDGLRDALDPKLKN